MMPSLAVIAYGIWFFFLKLRGSLLAIVRAPGGFEAELAGNLSRLPLDANLARYEDAPDPLSHVVAHVIRAVRQSRQPGEAFDAVQREHLSRIDRDTVLLSALTVAAPLLGLLGTVIGMIATFRAVASPFGNTAVQVSAGISQALITTQCGLVVAIPGLFGMARVQRLFDQARVRLGACRTHLMIALEQPPHPGAPS